MYLVPLVLCVSFSFVVDLRFRFRVSVWSAAVECDCMDFNHSNVFSFFVDLHWICSLCPSLRNGNSCVSLSVFSYRNWCLWLGICSIAVERSDCLFTFV